MEDNAIREGFANLKNRQQNMMHCISHPAGNVPIDGRHQLFPALFMPVWSVFGGWACYDPYTGDGRVTEAAIADSPRRSFTRFRW